MTGWVLGALLACGSSETVQTPNGEPETEAQAAATPDQASPGSTDERPTADQILTAHIQQTAQCGVLKSGSYVFNWASKMDDGHSKPNVEAILHQGRPGVSFTRIHQRREPNVRFAAFGRTPEGKYWSASDGGIQADLPEEAATPLMAGMDPTPVCNFEQRWPTRQLVGPEDRNGIPTWHLRVTWADGTGSDLWFHREAKVLVASAAKVGDIETTTELADYREHQGISWPTTEIATRQEGPVRIRTTQTLEKLELDPDSYREVGPEQVAAILATAAAKAK